MLVALILYTLAQAAVPPASAPSAAPVDLAPNAQTTPAIQAPFGTTGTIVRRTVEVPWACAGEVSIAQVEQVNAPIRRIFGVSTVWTTQRDRLVVAPFAYVTGPPSGAPALTVTHFDITDEGWISLLEGRGLATFYGDRADGANGETCSGARIFLWIELDD